MELKPGFTALDYFVFFGTIAIAFSIGVVFAIRDRRKKRDTPEEYFLAGRKAKMIPVTLSFVVTFQSSITMLGNPAEVYAYGIMVAYNAVAVCIAFITTAFFIVPVFHPLQLTSVYQYFQLRYNDNYLRYWTMITGSFYSIFYMGTVTYGTSVALEIVMGIPIWATILIYTMITAIYTSIGGIKAVIWTDVFQFFIMVTGIVAVVTKATIDTGGSAKVFEFATTHMQADEISLDPRIRYSIWNICVGGITYWLYTSFMQPAMQRVYTTPDVRTARKLYLATAPIYSALLLLSCFEGVVIFAYYVSKRCDILEGGVVNNINGIIPFTVLELFRQQPGLPGLFIAALSSAALSTLSSCLSSLSAVTYEDIIKVWRPDMNAARATKISKIVVLVYGVIALVMSFVISAMPGTVLALFQAFVSCLDGSTCAVFLLSTMFRRATTKGVFTGAVLGMAFPLWINLGKLFTTLPSNPLLPSGPVDTCSQYLDDVASNNHSYIYTNSTSFPVNLTLTSPVLPSTTHTDLSFPENLYTMSFMWLSLSGFLISMITGVVISYLTKPPQKYDERCVFSFQKHVVDELFGSSKGTEKLEKEEMNVISDQSENYGTD